MSVVFQKRPPIRTDKTDETPVQAHSSPEIQRNTPAEALTKLTKPRNQGEPMHPADPDQRFKDELAARARAGDMAARREALRQIALCLEDGQMLPATLRAVGADLLRAAADAADAVAQTPRPVTNDDRDRRAAVQRLSEAVGAPAQRKDGRRPGPARRFDADAVAAAHEVIRRAIGSSRADEQIAEVMGVDARSVGRYRKGYTLAEWMPDDLERMGAPVLAVIRRGR